MSFNCPDLISRHRCHLSATAHTFIDRISEASYSSIFREEIRVQQSRSAMSHRTSKIRTLSFRQSIVHLLAAAHRFIARVPGASYNENFRQESREQEAQRSVGHAAYIRRPICISYPNIHLEAELDEFNDSGARKHNDNQCAGRKKSIGSPTSHGAWSPYTRSFLYQPLQYLSGS